MKTQKTMLQLISLIALLNACNLQNPTTIEEADRVYFQMDAKLAYEHYDKIWSDSTFAIKDKAKAARKMATMQWLLYNEPNKSYEILQALEKLGYEKSRCYDVWARILTEEDDFDNAVDKAKKAMKFADSESSIYHSQIRFITTVLEKYKSGVFGGSTGQIQTPEFLEAQELINSIMTEKPGDILASDLHLGISLLAGDYSNAYSGWLSFYRADQAGNVHQSLQNAQNKFKQSLFADENEPRQEQIANLILGLSESGFIEYGAMVIKKYEQDYSFENAQINDLWNYYNALQNIKKHTVDFYRATVVGKENEKEYRDLMSDESKSLWNKLAWSDKKPKFKDERLLEELSTRFKTVVKPMKANGYFGLSAGHIVLDEERLVEQYDKKGTLQYIALDHMISNGYSSWFWDGRAEIGGWAPDGSSILQVRSAYSSSPIRAWLMVTDSVEMPKVLSKIKTRSEQDDAIAQENPYAYLPGLSGRMDFNAKNKILQDLLAKDLSGPELRTEFINTYEKLRLESSIFAHEGRHAIDKKYSGKLSSEELEFRAKLSEIYFSDHPFLAAGAVISENIGDGTSHGQANQRVLKGIVGWMENHKTEIQGLDTNRPLLPQLDILTEAQLKSAVRSFDPLAD